MIARALLVGALLALGCAHAPPAPGVIADPLLPRNLHCVEHENPDGTGACAVYRSAQPSAAEFSVLAARFGLRSDIKLNTALLIDGGPDRLPGGVEEYHHPWSPIGPVMHEEVVDALDDLDRAPRPTLVHCTHGVDRTGLLIALWRVRHDVPAPLAWAEWRSYPRSTFDELFYVAFERETGFHIPEDER